MSEEQKDLLISDDMWVYGYTVIDNGVIYCKDITDSEFRTYAVVRSLVNQRKAIAWPSYDTIAELSGHSERTAMRNVAKLEKLDLIQKIKRSGTSNHFIVKKIQNSSVLRNEQDIQGWRDHQATEKPKEPKKKEPEKKEPEKDPIPYKKIIDHLNATAGKKFSHKGSAHQKLIKARWNEDNNIHDFINVIDIKTSQWKDSDMDQYLRPSTLFGNKFDQYKNESPNTKPPVIDGQAQDNRFGGFLNSDD